MARRPLSFLARWPLSLISPRSTSSVQRGRVESGDNPSFAATWSAERPNCPVARMAPSTWAVSRGRSGSSAASASVEGSGWGWLVWEPMSGRLMIIQGEKQQDLMITGVLPILGLDVWEHAYYLRYQNRRRAYCEAFFEVINWSKVSELLERVAPSG